MQVNNIAIVGSRTFNNYELLKEKLFNFLFGTEKDFYYNSYNTTVISGGAGGADKLGERFADEYGLNKKIFYPNWDKFGKSAGFIRNKDIIKNSDVVFAFWDYKSKGTKNSIDLARKYGKILYIIDTRNHCG